ncbi:hypothetical protein A2753_04575 [Candidatus Uhrbacteria bacterium RIFCSPHIGHO2_01_FULL_47_11]|nr:MAG: hypothetical protein A2753_04575 [Candidatus Uhrbacteria bacterium RIFCSPHIGHO2_01_FULL_47_11]
MFKDRKEAGERLAQALMKYKSAADTIVLALPRGGEVVGYGVARVLNLPLDIVVPRKIGAPGNPEYAIGAITETGDAIFNENEIRVVDKEWLKQEMEKEKKEAQRRLQKYHPSGKCSAGLHVPLSGGQAPALRNATVIIVDDGIATGYTMRAAIASVKSHKPAKIVVAVPNCAADSIKQIRKEVDEVVVLEIPPVYFAVGAQYEDFPQTSDEEVIKLLRNAQSHNPS